MSVLPYSSFSPQNQVNLLNLMKAALGNVNGACRYLSKKVVSLSDIDLYRSQAGLAPLTRVERVGLVRDIHLAEKSGFIETSRGFYRPTPTGLSVLTGDFFSDNTRTTPDNTGKATRAKHYFHTKVAVGLLDKDGFGRRARGF